MAVSFFRLCVRLWVYILYSCVWASVSVLYVHAYVYVLIFSAWVIPLGHLHHTSPQGAAQATRLLQSFPERTFKAWSRYGNL